KDAALQEQIAALQEKDTALQEKDAVISIFVEDLHKRGYTPEQISETAKTSVGRVNEIIEKL
ncbi:MAG: hypothetical protein LBT42_03980, partial [Tannerella sp.]|nr:hypothetical protein [Tannerella sp.]